MEETLTLARSKSKHPAHKTTLEREKVTSKVTKANKKRRQEMVKLDPRYEQRFAEMDAEVELIQLENDETRLSQARDLELRAELYMAENGVGSFAEAVVAVSQEEAKLSSPQEPTVGEVERYMKDHDLSDFGQALRSLATDRLHHEQAFGTPNTRMFPAQEDAEYRRIARERGLDV